MKNTHQRKNSEPSPSQEDSYSTSYENESKSNQNTHIKQETTKTKKEETNSEKNKENENFENHQITLSLSGSKLVFLNGRWIDLTDSNEVSNMVHPLIVQNNNLKKKYELLLGALAESNFEIEQNQKELESVETVISQLKEILASIES